MADENLLHIKLERGEYLESKRDILASQIALLKILEKIKNYEKLRDEELQLKLNLSRRFKELRISIGSLQKSLPVMKEPKKTKEEIKREKSLGKTEKGSLSVEQQLQEIQRRLDDLQRKNI